MKYFLMCEGPNEEVLLNLLLNSNALRIKREDLIGLKVYPIKQITHPSVISELKIYGSEVTILRVGDTLTDDLRIPFGLSHVISEDRIKKYCTKPELEMLLIISEGLLSQYNKVKSSVKPKNFAKQNIIFNGKRYNQSCDFLYNYYKNNIDKLIKSLVIYKRLKKHNKGELYLADLLDL